MFQLFSQVNGNVMSCMLIVIMIATFAFGIVCGFRLIDEENKGLRMLRWYFGIQIPCISSPLFSYHLSSGIGISAIWTGHHITFSWRIGSEMGVWVLQEHPWAIGINVVALILFIWVCRILKTPNQ